MIDPAISVKEILVDAHIGDDVGSTLVGWPIAIGRMGDTPDKHILVNHTGGLAPYPHIALDEPSVQVQVRGQKNGYQAAKDKLLEVKDRLLGMDDFVAGIRPGYLGDIYRACTMISDITYLGQDDNTRPLFSANFRFVVLPQPSGNRVAIT